MIAVPVFLSAGIDASAIVNVVNYVTLGLLVGSLVIVFLGFLRGLFRGWRYGTYRLVMFALLAAVAMLTLQPIVNAVGTFDLGQLGLGSSWELPSFTLNVNGTSVTIASEGTTAFTVVSGYIENLCKALNVNMAPADLSAYALSLAVSLVSFFLIMVDAILIAIFGTFFVFLLWHLAFKRFISKDKRKASYRKGKIVGGLTNCLVSVLCLAMFLAPLTSMANSLSAAWNGAQLDEEDQTVLHTVDNSIYQAIDGVVDAYDNSAFAKAFFSWNKDSEGKSLDVKLVEFLTSTSVSLGEQEKIQMSFLNELSSLAEVFTIAVQSGVVSEEGFDNIKWPLLLTTSAAPEALRSLAGSRLVTGVLPYGLSILENIDPVSSYIKVGTGIDFSGNYELTLEELADIYDTVLDSNLVEGIVDPETGELGASSVVAGNVLSEDNASVVASVFSSLDGENLQIFDALIESALTIQAYKDYESGNVASEELTVADFLPAVNLSDFAPEEGKPTLIPEAYKDIKWGEIFADFFLSTVNLVNVDPDLYLAVCNAIPDWNGEQKPFSYQDFLAPILEDGNFEKAKAALVGTSETAKAAAGEADDGAITPLLGTEFLLNATPKLITILENSLNESLQLSEDKAVDLSEIAIDMAADHSIILPEWSALLEVVGDFATTEAGREFLLHVEAMPGIYFAPDQSFVGVDEGLADGLVAGLAGLDSSRLATAIIPQAFEGFLEGEDSPIADLGVELTFDFTVPNIGSQLSNLLTTLVDAQDLLAYLASLNGQNLTGGPLKNAISTIADHSGELADLLSSVAASPMLNPVVGGQNNANIVSLIGLVFSTIGLKEPENLSATLSGLAPEATAAEMEHFVAALVNVMDSGLVDAALDENIDLGSFAEVSFEAAFAKFDESLIFRDCFGPVLDGLLEDSEAFASFFAEGFSFANVTDWQKEGQNLDVLIASVDELGAAGLLDGGTIDVFNSDPGAVENIVSVLATSDLFVSREEGGTYTYSFPRIVAKMIEDNLPAGSEAASFFKVPDGDGVAALALDIRSTAVEGGSAADVEASQDLWKEEAHRFALILRDILSLGGIDSIAVDGGMSLKEMSPEPLDFLLRDATELLVFGRVLNYSLYSLLSEQIAATFPSAEGLSNLDAFYEPTLASYQETIAVSGNVFESEAETMSKLVYAVLDPSTGIAEAIGEDGTVSIDINDVSPEYLVRPLLQSLSGSQLFNSLAAGNAKTAYEGILGTLLEDSGLFEEGEAESYVTSVRGDHEDFAAIVEAWDVENEAIVATVSAVQESGVSTDSLASDPMSFFAEGSSYSLQRARLENILVAAADSKIIRPALASIVETGAASIGEGYAVNSEWLLEASSAEYKEEARTLSYVMLYGSLVDDLGNLSIGSVVDSPAAENLLREAARSYVFNTLPAGEEGYYPAFVQMVDDILSSSGYYGDEGDALTSERIDEVIGRIDVPGMEDEARFASWEEEIDALMDALSTLEETGLELSGSIDVGSLFPGGAEEALLDEREASLAAFLVAANDSRLVYPGLASVLSEAVSNVSLPNGASLENANYYYGERGSADIDYGFLSAPYDDAEMERLAAIVRRANALSAETDFSIENLSGTPDAEILLRNLAASAIFDSLAEERSSSSDFGEYTVFENLLASSLEASGFYGSDGASSIRIEEILGRALTEEGSSRFMTFEERNAFWNGDGTTGEIASLVALADSIAEGQNLGIDFGSLSFAELFADAAEAETVRTALYGILDAASSCQIVYPAIPLNLESATGEGDSFSLEGADFYYTGRWGSQTDLLERPYADAENERLSYVAMYAGLLGSTDLSSLDNIDGGEVGGLLANMSSSYIFNAASEGSPNAFVGALNTLLSDNATISGLYFSSENPVNAYLGYAGAEEKAAGLAEERYPALSYGDEDAGKRNWGDFLTSEAGDGVTSLEAIIDSEGLGSVIDGLAGEGAVTLPKEREELSSVLALVSGSPLLKDMVPNAVRKALQDGSGIAFEGVDFARSNPYFAYFEAEWPSVPDEDATSSALALRWFSEEEIASIVDVVYDAESLNSFFSSFDVITREAIGNIRVLLQEMAGSKVFNSVPFEATPGFAVTDSSSGASVPVDSRLNVFQGTLFYMMVETFLYERAYNPVLDAERGFPSAGAKLTSSLFAATGSFDDSFETKRSLGEKAVDALVSDGLDGGLLNTVFQELSVDGSLALDFSNEGVLDFEDINPTSLGKILQSLNAVDFCEGVIANGAEYLLSDAINLGAWSMVTTDRKLEGERGSLRLNEIAYVGTGTAPSALYYHYGEGYRSVSPDANGVYSFRDENAPHGESSLVGPTDVYLDAGLTVSLFASDSAADFSFVYDLSTYHLLTREQYRTGAIPSLVRFLGNVLYDYEAESYDQIESADDFFAPLLDGSGEGGVDYVYEIASFLLNADGFFNADFDKDGGILSSDPDAGNLAYISGDILVRNFLQFSVSVPAAPGEALEVDLGSLFLHEVSSDPVATERSLISSIHEAMYEEANMVSGSGEVPTYAEREAAYPGGLTYLSENLAAITTAAALYQAAESYVYPNASKAFKELFLASSNTLGLMEKASGALSLTSVANNVVSSLVNTSFASGLAFEAHPNRGFLGIVVSIEGISTVTIGTVQGLPSSTAKRQEIDALGGAMPTGLEELRAISYASDPDFYRALYAVLSEASGLLERTVDASYVSAIEELNTAGLTLENVTLRGLASTLLDSYFYELVVGGLYIHTLVAIGENSTAVYGSGGRLLSTAEIAALKTSSVDFDGSAHYFGTDGYLAQAAGLIRQSL